MKFDDTATDVLSDRPPCDFCGSPAYADGKTLMGPWAYMCVLCYEGYGVGLGMGQGQRILIDP